MELSLEQRLSKLDELRELEELERQRARYSLMAYTLYTFPTFIVKWYHQLICSKLEDLAEGLIRKLMILLPPQHGKSELASRRFPAWAMGKMPWDKIALITYAHTFSAKFNRHIQRQIISPEYQTIFPDTKLAGMVKNSIAAQSNLEFELVNQTGTFQSLGVGGGISGNTVDIGIIDDPFKSYAEASSPTIRQRVWDWYVDDYDSRLSNTSRTLLINTRRHEDDLSGRLLDAEPGEWEVIRIPAIKEDNELKEDPRKIGQPLFPEKHSLESLLKSKNLSPRTFASLYQNRPAPAEGDILKRKWFRIMTLPEIFAIVQSKQVVHFIVDPAHETKKDSDPTGMMGYFIHNNILYVTAYKAEKLLFPELVRTLKSFVMANGYSPQSKINVEPTASGKPLVTTLREQSNLSILEDKSPTNDKLVKANMISPICEAQRIVLLKAHWNEAFLTELCSFPNAAHDESLDCLYMGVSKMNLFSKFGLTTTVIRR